MEKETQSLVPIFVCFVAFVVAIIIPVAFIRDPSVWVILLGLSPFGLLQLVGLYFIADAFTKAGPLDLMN